LTGEKQGEKLHLLFMLRISDPNQIVGELAIGGFALAGLWRLIIWIRDAPSNPDPWSAEIEESLQQADATPVCHRCLSPYPDDIWFCEACGAAVGPYNNFMPYVCIFSQGEVLRNGVTDKLRVSRLTIVGYLLYSLGNYLVFAPIYWFFFFKNLKRRKEEKLIESSKDI
jgi:hypothetical protein